MGEQKRKWQSTVLLYLHVEQWCISILNINGISYSSLFPLFLKNGVDGSKKEWRRLVTGYEKCSSWHVTLECQPCIIQLSLLRDINFYMRVGVFLYVDVHFNLNEVFVERKTNRI